jgi:TolB protein
MIGLIALTLLPLVLLMGALAAAFITVAPALPPGDQLLYLSYPDANGRTALYIYDFRHDFTVMLRDDLVGSTLDAAWSPDGSTIAYSNTRPGEAERSIYLLDMRTGGSTEITTQSGDFNTLSWSPDGTQLAYAAKIDGQSFAVYVHDLATGARREVFGTPDNNADPVWSPDGETLLITSSEVFSIQHEIYKLRLVDGTVQQLFTRDAKDVVTLDWSPDSQRMVYAAAPQGRNYNLYIADPDGRNTRRLTDLASASFEPSWSPDGNRIAFASNHNGVFQIYVLDLAADALVSVSGPGNYRSPDWRP